MCLRMHLYAGAYTNYKYQDSRYLLRKYCAIMKKKLYESSGKLFKELY